MTELAIIDLDGVVADNTARFAKAEEAKQKFINSQGVLCDLPGTQKKAIDLYWQTAFDPELVKLDTLIEGVYEAINKLMAEGFQIIYLTSRPEPMRLATLAWLGDHDILHYANGGNIVAIDLVMKAPAFQYTKTTVWKAGMVHTLVALHVAEEVLFIDDEQANIDELYKHGFEDSLKLRCYTSLAEAHEQA